MNRFATIRRGKMESPDYTRIFNGILEITHLDPGLWVWIQDYIGIITPAENFILFFRGFRCHFFLRWWIWLFFSFFRRCSAHVLFWSLLLLFRPCSPANWSYTHVFLAYRCLLSIENTSEAILTWRVWLSQFCVPAIADFTHFWFDRLFSCLCFMLLFGLSISFISWFSRNFRDFFWCFITFLFFFNWSGRFLVTSNSWCWSCCSRFIISITELAQNRINFLIWWDLISFLDFIICIFFWLLNYWKWFKDCFSCLWFRLAFLFLLRIKRPLFYLM